MNIHSVALAFEKLDAILNAGLRVLAVFTKDGIAAGDVLHLVDEACADNPDRVFFANVSHVFPVADFFITQIDLQAFMMARGAEDKMERIPMLGEFANEKVNAMPCPWTAGVSGEKPVWIYEGKTWAAEIMLHSLSYDKEKRLGLVDGGNDYLPDEISLKVSQRGGERIVKFAPVK